VGDLQLVREHWNRCRQAKRPGIVLIGEGRL
jgi:hypothetical protein